MILERFKLTDRVAIVTGAGRGIGRGIAVALAEAGADVICAARTPSEIEETAELVAATGSRGLPLACDVNDSDQLRSLVERARDDLGRLDIVVNNAGGTLPMPVLDTDAAFFDEAIHFNCTAPLELIRFAAPVMVETAGAGAVVNIASRAGQMPVPGLVAYGTAKAALTYLTRVVAAELAPKVRVNVIAVGAVRTSALELVLADDTMRETMVSRTPMGRVGEVEDVAACALYLASPAAAWVTGKCFEVDGGSEMPAIDMPVPRL